MRKKGLIGRAMTIGVMLKEMKPKDFSKYTAHFSELSFTEKLHRVGMMLGETVLLPLLQLYYIYRSPEVPLKGKLYITGALGYFIFPMDFLPDFLPALFGFSDDIIVIGIVMKQVERYLTPEIDAKARHALTRFCK
ncbi:YkvA family protein [Porphyromonas levii]|uniref:DUF1232 domain-containing protein n=1 Tax=Porphyromonas levii TaxID=28114 RepID=A0A4Y8WRY2_9PORP|nr:YkvA family protein [Porphyromonas levii]TFH95798.1 DUF1232 domain-containing protein [Porphyromonas levii]TFH95906.1 DUF1232 domain-containing protein [Porphyromonas levii]